MPHRLAVRYFLGFQPNDCNPEELSLLCTDCNLSHTLLLASKAECCSDLNLFAEMPHRQAKHSVDMDLYLNEKDIKNIKIFDKKCECYEWFKIC